MRFKLLEPIELRAVRCENRVVLAPMASASASAQGLPSDITLETYAPLAASGVGLAIVEHHAVHRGGRARVAQLMADSDDLVEELKSLPALFRQARLPVFAQISHAGALIRDDKLLAEPGFVPAAPSELPHPDVPGQIPRALPEGEVRDLPAFFASGARRLIAAGYDGVEIHACHGYLLSQFLSPLTNVRKDVYGGSTANRARLLFECYEAVRAELDNDIPVAVRLGLADYLPGQERSGLTLEESVWIARELASMEVDLLDLSGNLCGYDGPGEAWFAPFVRVVRDAVGKKVPVVCTGGIRSSVRAEELLRHEICDLVGVGRPLLKDPDTVNKWKEELR